MTTAQRLITISCGQDVIAKEGFDLVPGDDPRKIIK